MTNASNTGIDLFRWTVDDYHRLVTSGILDEDAPVELLNGQIIYMNPAGDAHAACIDMLDELLRDLLGKTVIIRVQSPVVLEEVSEPEPDIAVLKRKDNFYADGHPRPQDILLLIEVADSTVVKDRTVKKEAYAAAGIDEYWIVNLPDRQVEQYLRPENGEYGLVHIYKEEQILHSALCGEVPVDEILPHTPEN